MVVIIIVAVMAVINSSMIVHGDVYNTALSVVVL